MKIIFEPTANDPFLVIWKDKNIPSAPLLENEANTALDFAKKHFPEIALVKGRTHFDAGLVHRLDTLASGLLLFATTQQSFDAFIEMQKVGNFKKTYIARCIDKIDNAKILGSFPSFEKYREDFLKNGYVRIESFFRAYGKEQKEVRPVTEESSHFAKKKAGKKLYATNLSIIEKKHKNLKIECSIASGFRHQVRCHLAFLGFPIIGDVLYNSNFRKESREVLQFECVSLSFLHPLTGKNVFVG